MNQHKSILIIGSGPSGYTAAIYSARAMLKTLVISGIQEGGQLTITNDVENYPGFAEPISGPFLMEQMKKQAERVGVEILQDIVIDVDVEKKPFSLLTESGRSYTCDALIIASGASPRWLNVPGEKELMGFGVSSCATCDGFFYRGKDVVVVGGGNTAFEEALYLSSLAKNVFLVHRRDSFRAERLLQNRLFAQKNIHVLTNTIVEEIIGTKEKRSFVSGVSLQNVLTNSIVTMPTDAVFVAIGHLPGVDLFSGKLKQKDSGHLWTALGSTKTSIPGVFAAGDVVDDVYRQAITAAASGCMAALDAEKYLCHIKDEA